MLSKSENMSEETVNVTKQEEVYFCGHLRSKKGNFLFAFRMSYVFVLLFVTF